jgi:hypothetical protein
MIFCFRFSEIYVHKTNVFGTDILLEVFKFSLLLPFSKEDCKSRLYIGPGCNTLLKMTVYQRDL